MTAGQGGFGATRRRDGYGPLMTLMHGDNPRIATEILEGRFPIRVRGRQAAPQRRWQRARTAEDPGVEHDVRGARADVPAHQRNRTSTPPWGLAGGEPGKPGQMHIKRPGGHRWARLGQVSHLPLEAGTLVRVRTGGGGGWGTR